MISRSTDQDTGALMIKCEREFTAEDPLTETLLADTDFMLDCLANAALLRIHMRHVETAMACWLRSRTAEEAVVIDDLFCITEGIAISDPLCPPYEFEIMERLAEAANGFEYTAAAVKQSLLSYTEPTPQVL